MCRLFPLGQCRWGNKCQFKHVKPAAPAANSDEGSDKEKAKRSVKRPEKKTAGPAVLPAGAAVRFSDCVEIIEIASCLGKADRGEIPHRRYLAPIGAGKPAAASLEEQILEKKRQIKELKAVSALYESML